MRLKTEDRGPETGRGKEDEREALEYGCLSRI